ncbi:MAG: 50S ribosomal protein L24 [Deltaproteobacteria bacterium]|nr:50S ribosomal protein L24 [Deltaproteobacteria bacterium]
MLARIRRGDTVEVRKGKERSDHGRGEVIRIDPKRGLVFVAKLRLVKRHTRPSQKQRTGGIVEREAGIPVANVLLVCPKCARGRRTHIKTLDDGRKVRSCASCGEHLATKGNE